MSARGVSALVALSGLLGVVSTPPPPPEPFTPGAICDGIDLNEPSYNLLRGRHLVVIETNYRPFGYKNASAPHGWSGYDLDVFDQVSRILGKPRAHALTGSPRHLCPHAGPTARSPAMRRPLANALFATA